MMKFITAMFLFISTLQLGAQDVQPIYKSLEKSDFRILIDHLDDPLELCINDQQDILDKRVAVERIRNFFKDARPVSITQLHKGSSTTKESQYRVAKLNTQKGNFRLFLYLEKTRQGFVIKELRIDKET